MRPDGLRERTRAQAQRTAPKLQTRLSKGEKQGRKRMAEIVTVHELTPEPGTAADIVPDAENPPAPSATRRRRRRTSGSRPASPTTPERSSPPCSTKPTAAIPSISAPGSRWLTATTTRSTGSAPKPANATSRSRSSLTASTSSSTYGQPAGASSRKATQPPSNGSVTKHGRCSTAERGDLHPYGSAERGARLRPRTPRPPPPPRSRLVVRAPSRLRSVERRTCRRAPRPFDLAQDGLEVDVRPARSTHRLLPLDRPAMTKLVRRKSGEMSGRPPMQVGTRLQEPVRIMGQDVDVVRPSALVLERVDGTSDSAPATNVTLQRPTRLDVSNLRVEKRSPLGVTCSGGWFAALIASSGSTCS